MNQISSNRFIGKIIGQMQDMQSESKAFTKLKGSDEAKSEGALSFQDHLRQGLSEVNQHQATAETMQANLVSGKSENIHETMLAATKAELSFNLMVQLRNKALEAYSEIMRMQV